MQIRERERRERGERESERGEREERERVREERERERKEGKTESPEAVGEKRKEIFIILPPTDKEKIKLFQLDPTGTTCLQSMSVPSQGETVIIFRG